MRSPVAGNGGLNRRTLVNHAFIYGNYEVKLLQCMRLRACLKKSGHRSRRFSVALPKSTHNFRTLTLLR
jgi:hypothetical protein